MRARLYTEMVTADAVIHGDRDRLIGFDPAEHPLALQLGGSDPKKLARAARIGRDFGYDEINLNVGCPSDRVQSGRFGACLMAEPGLVAECLAEMSAAVDVPVTVKCRIGIDAQNPTETFPRFVEQVAAAGVRVFIVHARMAWLEGLSPKENRDIPPLDYGLVRSIKEARPDLCVVLNGGIQTLSEAKDHLDWADGVMLGRAAYRSPGLLAEVDRVLFGVSDADVSKVDAVRSLYPYLDRRMAEGVPLIAITRHMLGLFAGQPGARTWRRLLTEEARAAGAGIEVLERALEAVTGAAPARNLSEELEPL